MTSQFHWWWCLKLTRRISHSSHRDFPQRRNKQINKLAVVQQRLKLEKLFFSLADRSSFCALESFIFRVFASLKLQLQFAVLPQFSSQGFFFFSQRFALLDESPCDTECRRHDFPSCFRKRARLIILVSVSFSLRSKSFVFLKPPLGVHVCA